MSRFRTASFLLAAASLGSLAAATATRSILAVVASAAVLAVTCASWFPLARREAREARDRIEALGQPYRDVLRMASRGVVRQAYVRGMDLASSDEGGMAA